MGPGTPNSGTTSLSALSTTAIKDGQQGHALPHHHSTAASRNVLDAERADRISRLAGLERVATARQSGLSAPAQGLAHNAPPGYFDGINPSTVKERSTVGSASATGSVGGVTTWASSSDVHDVDKMSEEQDDGVSSTGALSDEGNASLVGFGEGASSTISGPISARVQSGGRQGSVASPSASRSNMSSPLTPQAPGSMMSGIVPTGDSTHDARAIDRMTFGSNAIDPSNRTSEPSLGHDHRGTAKETAETILGNRITDGEASSRPIGSPDEGLEGGKGLGRFPFEEK
ncbi:MAG: hypothetical protein M1814_002556 [Vezdaea aestivalis]|nr:MAG: hypothetical protein M1814_002556 [Vezdaea aestivalis]